MHAGEISLHFLFYNQELGGNSPKVRAIPTLGSHHQNICPHWKTFPSALALMTTVKLRNSVYFLFFYTCYIAVSCAVFLPESSQLPFCVQEESATASQPMTKPIKAFSNWPRLRGWADDITSSTLAKEYLVCIDKHTRVFLNG